MHKLTAMTILCMMVLSSSLVLIPNEVSAGTSYTWDGGDVASQLASDADNWNPNGVPTTGDTVMFDATSDEACTWDITAALATFTVNPGYDGTITQASNMNVYNLYLYSGSYVPSRTYNTTVRRNIDTEFACTITNYQMNLITLSSTPPTLVDLKNRYVASWIINSNATLESTMSVHDGTFGYGKFSLASGKVLNVGSYDLQVTAYSGASFNNDGQITGTGSVSLTFKGNQSESFGNVDCNLVLKASNVATGNVELNLDADNVLENVSVYSEHATYTMSVDTAGYDLTCNELNIGALGIIKNDASTASIISLNSFEMTSASSFYDGEKIETRFYGSYEVGSTYELLRNEIKIAQSLCVNSANPYIFVSYLNLNGIGVFRLKKGIYTIDTFENLNGWHNYDHESAYPTNVSIEDEKMRVNLSQNAFNHFGANVEEYTISYEMEIDYMSLNSVAYVTIDNSIRYPVLYSQSLRMQCGWVGVSNTTEVLYLYWDVFGIGTITIPYLGEIEDYYADEGYFKVEMNQINNDNGTYTVSIEVLFVTTDIVEVCYQGSRTQSTLIMSSVDYISINSLGSVYANEYHFDNFTYDFGGESKLKILGDPELESYVDAEYKESFAVNRVAYDWFIQSTDDVFIIDSYGRISGIPTEIKEYDINISLTWNDQIVYYNYTLNVIAFDLILNITGNPSISMVVGNQYYYIFTANVDSIFTIDDPSGTLQLTDLGSKVVVQGKLPIGVWQLSLIAIYGDQVAYYNWTVTVSSSFAVVSIIGTPDTAINETEYYIFIASSNYYDVNWILIDASNQLELLYSSGKTTKIVGNMKSGTYPIILICYNEIGTAYKNWTIIVSDTSWTNVHSFFGNSTGLDPWTQMHYLFGNSTGVNPWTEMHNGTLNSTGIYVEPPSGENYDLNLGSLVWLLVFFIPVILLTVLFKDLGTMTGITIMSIAASFMFPMGIIVMIIGIASVVIIVYGRYN